MTGPPDPPPRTSGWVVFAGVVLVLAAAVNVIHGATLLLHDEWIVLTPEPVVFDLTTVGIVFLASGALLAFVAMGVFTGELWARVLGMVAASLNLLAQFAFSSVYPQWAWVAIVVDGLVIYALAVHGDEVTTD